MLKCDILKILVIFGLATLKQVQTENLVLEMKETSSGQEQNTVQKINSTDFKISLLYCCPYGNPYRAFLDTCKFLIPREDNSTEPQLDNLSVYSTHTNQIIEIPQQFDLTIGSMADCPDGYFGNSTRDFKLFDDGSLRIGEKRLEPKSFCINELIAPYENNLIHVARYCDPDPCSVNGAKCIRKCCPQGMVFNSETNTCEPNPIPFEISEWKDENNEPINRDSFTVFGGLGIKCLRLGVRDFIVNHTAVVFLPDGRMKNLDIPCKALELEDRITENYCADNQLIENRTELYARRCFPIQFKEPDIEKTSVYPYLKMFSSVFIIVTLLIYSILPKLRNSFGVVVMCYLASMTVTYLGLVTIQLYPEMPEGMCATLPVITHFSLLANYSWLNVMCFDLWRVFGTEVRSNRPPKDNNGLSRSFIFYSIYGWGLPLIIVVTGQILQYVEDSSKKCALITPNFEYSCWFYYYSSKIAYFYGPIGVMILSNIIMFLWASIKFCISSLETKQATGNSRVFQRFRVILSLFVLMGVSLVTEVVSVFTGGTFTEWVVNDSINLLIGFFVFVIFICKPTVWRMLKEKFSCCLPVWSACHRFSIKRFPSKNNPRTSTSMHASPNITESTAATTNITNETSLYISS